MVKQISGTLTITIRKQDQNYTIEAKEPKGIKVDPQPAPQLKTLLSDQQITDILKELSSETAPAKTDAEITAAIQKLGTVLYESLFSDTDIIDAFGQAKGIANSDSGVRLRLQIEPAELAALPWETLHDGKDWLSAQSTTPLVRKLDLSENRKPLQKLEIRGALRILFVGASPEGLHDLKVEKTANELETLLAAPIKKKQIAFSKLLNATLEELRQELLKDYHILYFAGHGSPEGIVLHHHKVREDPYTVSAETLADALKGKQTRLVFLAACETSKAPDKAEAGSRLLRGFAQELAERSNLPAIVAMQYFISDMQANPLTTQFFAALAAGRPVDVAMAEARSGLIKKGQVSRDVFSPVLYLQAEDGALFPKAQNWLAISLGVALLIAAIVGGGFARSAEINQVRDLTSSSEAKLGSGAGLDAVMDSLRAGKTLQHSVWQFVLPEGLREQVMSQLSKTLYAGQERNRLEGHGVVFSPDGKTIASASDNTVTLWNLEGKELHTLQHSNIVDSAVFSPDSKTIASMSDKTVTLWSLEGKELHTLPHGAPVSDVVFSPDGKTIASASSDGIGGPVKLWNLEGKKLHTLPHGDIVLSMVFSPDGKTIASASFDNTVKLWNLEGKKLHTLPHSAPVSDVVFSPDGKTIASASFDNTVKLWNLEGKELHTLPHGVPVSDVVFSPDGKTIASVADNTVTLWDLKGKKLYTLLHSAPVTSVVFSPVRIATSSGLYYIIASASDDNTVKLWNMEGQVLQTFRHSDGVNSVVFSPDGNTVASASNDNIVKLWNLEGSELHTFQYADTVSSVVFSPDGKTIASVADTAKLWDLERQKLYTLPHGDGDIVRSLVFSPDSKTIASASDDNTVKLWNLEGKVLHTLHHDAPDDVVFSPDGKTIASTSGDDHDGGYVIGTLKLWNLEGKVLHTFQHYRSADPYGSTSVVFSPDSKTVTFASSDGTVKLWNLEEQEFHILRHTADPYGSTSVVFSPDGKTIASTYDGENNDAGVVKLWNLEGKKLYDLPHSAYPYEITSIVFSPDSKAIASASGDGTVKLWNLEGKELHTLQHADRVTSVVFSPVRVATPSGLDYIIASASWDNTVKLWDLEGKELHTLQHSDEVNSVVFSSDGKTIASASDDNTVKLWNLEGQELQTFQHNGAVNRVVFSPDGKTIASASDDLTVKLWAVEGFDETLEQGCNWVRDYLENNPNVAARDRHLCDGVGSRN
jgi:WD40 repeat protein/CHAT domain-containing protein